MTPLEHKIRRIADHYGAAHQLLKLAEEAAELSASATRLALTRFDDKEYTERFEALCEEAADVLVMLEQFAYHHECDEHIEAVFEAKVLRQCKRIDDEAECIEKANMSIEST